MSHQSEGRGRGRGRGRGDFNVPIRGGPGGGGRGGSGGPRGGGGGRGRGGGERGGGAGRGRGGAPPEVEVFSQGNNTVPAPDSAVAKIEDSTVVGERKQKLTWPNPPRPGYGTTGKEVLLWTNYFTLACAKGLELYRYSIDIVSAASGREPVGKTAKRIIQILLDEQFIPHGLDVATDFRSNLISREKLELQEEYRVAYRTEGEDEIPPNARQYRVRMQFTGSLTISELVNYLTSSQAGLLLNSKEEIIQGMNIVTGHRPKASAAIATVGANRHFDMNPTDKDRMSLGGGLQVIRGFFMSVRAATARILVNVQVKNMAFFEDGPLDRLMQAYITANGPNKVNLYKFVNKLSINVTHIQRRNKSGQVVPRIKIVRAFATKDDGRNLAHPPQVPGFGAGAKDVKFFLEAPQSGPSQSGPSQPATGGKKKGGKKPPVAGPDPNPQSRYVSVYDFFRDVYHVTIPDPSLPVINVGTKENPSYLPAVVCEVIPGQPARSRLNPAQTQQMIRFAVRRPVNNARSVVTSGAQMLGFEPPNQTLNTFGLKITPQLITVPGRVLDVPAIKYAGKDITIPRFGSWDMRASKFVTQAGMPKWTYLRISIQGRRSPWRSNEEFHDKLDELQGKLKELGIGVTNYMQGIHINNDANKIEGEIDNWVNRFAINPNRPSIILVVIPDYPGKTAIYNRIKFICDVKEGILNVCVLDTKFSRANPQYMANVGLKFNLKLGGRNHSLDPSKLGFLRHRKTMVVGIDVTHPSPGSASSAPSVAGIVASVDEWLGQWPADIRIQGPRQEMVSDLEGMLRSRLLLWQKHNKVLPDNILVYRDGISEGQYDIVLSTELPAMRAACEKVYPPAATKSGKPNITIIVVGKRHHTRFYPTQKSDADRGGNPQNGTVVDRGVTEARNWDFFLQAHTAIQGTARPAHYYVVYDQIFRDPALPRQFASAADALENLTHNLCYLFGRSTKAVSICPPAYYADLVCERARCYLSTLYDPSPLSSPDASSVGTATMSQAPDAGMVSIHERVRNSMFYI